MLKKQHIVTNALSQRLRHSNNINLNNKDINNQILTKLRVYKIYLIIVNNNNNSKELRDKDFKL